MATGKQLAVYAGALWHLGLEPEGTEVLRAASAPHFLADAVPRSWIATDNDPAALPTAADIDAGGKRGNREAQLAAYDPTWDIPSQVVA